MTSLLAGLFLPVVFAQSGYTLAMAAACVSYAAMAAKARISDFQEMTLCSVLVAILFTLSPQGLVGVGGRLGTIAAIAVVIVWGIKAPGVESSIDSRHKKHYISKIHLFRNAVAFIVFIGTGLLLFHQSWRGSDIGSTRLLLGLNLSVFVYGLYLHLRDFFTREIFEDSPDNLVQTVSLFPCAVVGTMLTYYLSATINFGPVTAAGTVGILAALFLDGPYAVLTYTAVFAGMSSPAILPSYYHVFLAGVVVWGVYIICRRIYQGFGSRLGTMAAGSVLIVQLLFWFFGALSF